MKYWLDGITSHGWAFVLAHLIPMHFTQDRNIVNNGKDTISFKSNTSYYYGKLKNNPYWIHIEKLIM